MSNPGSGLAIERADVTPAFCFGLEYLHEVTDAPDPVPSEGLDIAEPGAAEAGIGDDNGAAVPGYHLMELVKEAAMGTGLL